MPRLPNFLIVGTAKSGTTTIAHALNHHPEVFFPDAWEPNFFAFDYQYEKGIAYLEDLFADARGVKAAGTKSWRNSVKEVYPEAIPRIKRHLDVDRLKIIYIVRHPLERIESFWIECRSGGQDIVPPDFNQAVREEPLFLHSSRYWHQINQYRSFIPDERIHVVFFKDIKNDLESVLEQICRFLEVDANILAELPRPHKNQSKGKGIDRWGVRYIRRIPGLDVLRDAVPICIRRMIRKALKSRTESRPEWGTETRHWTIRQLQDDMQKFLNWREKPSNHWLLTEHMPT